MREAMLESFALIIYSSSSGVFPVSDVVNDVGKRKFCSQKGGQNEVCPPIDPRGHVIALIEFFSNIKTVRCS